MSFNTKINICFSAKNGKFKLEDSSENRSPEKKVATTAEKALLQVVNSLEATYRPLFTRAELIQAKLHPVIKEGSITHYEMELTLDGQLLTDTKKHPCCIQLNEKFVKALSGRVPSTSSPVVKPNPQPVPQTSPISKPALSMDDWVMVPDSSKTEQKSEPQKKIDSTPAKARPLLNQGNDCFINSLFQVIMNDEILLNALMKTFEKDQTPEAMAFKEAVNLYQKSQKSISVRSLRSFIQQQWGYSQEDASELLMRIINKLDDKKYPVLFPTYLTNNEWTLCKPASHPGTPQTHLTSVPSTEFFLPVQLPKTKSSNIPLNGQSLIQSIFKPHEHTGETAIFNQASYKPTSAWTSLQGNPDRLVFTLKRFHREGTKTVKIENPVDMPEILDVNGTLYSLKSCVIHAGTANSGHYYSIVRKESEWIKCNDGSITSTSDITKDRMNGYIYFYEKVS